MFSTTSIDNSFVVGTLQVSSDTQNISFHPLLIPSSLEIIKLLTTTDRSVMSSPNCDIIMFLHAEQTAGENNNEDGGNY